MIILHENKHISLNNKYYCLYIRKVILSKCNFETYFKTTPNSKEY
jgi:hypothetical protein